MSLYKPKAVYAASERNTLQQVEKFKYIVVVFTSGGRRSNEADRWIAKDDAVLRELYRSVVTKRESSTAKPSVFKSVLFRSLPTILNIGVREGILLGGRKKFALKLTICPKNRQLTLKLTF